MGTHTDNTFFLKHGHISVSSGGGNHVKLRSLYCVGYVIVIGYNDNRLLYELQVNGVIKFSNKSRLLCNRYLDSLYMNVIVLKDSNLFNGVND